LEGRQGEGARGSSPVPPAAIKSTFGVGLAGALMLVTLISLVLVAPFTGARAFYDLGVGIGVADPVAGAAFLFSSVPPVATRALFLLGTSALLVYLGWAGRRAGRLARMLLFGLVAGELIVANAGLNPVLPASRLGPPAWVAALAAHPAERFYFGGKLISYDPPLLWPIEQARAAAQFERADGAERLRFLARGGVRYCLLPAPPHPGAEPLQRVGEEFGTMAVYECVADARRAHVVAQASIVQDVTTQVEQLFEESFDAESTVMLRPTPSVRRALRRRRPRASRPTRIRRLPSTPPRAPKAVTLCCGTRSIARGVFTWTGCPRRCFAPTRSTAPSVFRLADTSSGSSIGRPSCMRVRRSPV
jgi:hypothetical protein